MVVHIRSTNGILLNQNMGELDGLGGSGQGNSPEGRLGGHGGNVNTAARDGTDFVDDGSTFADDGSDGTGRGGGEKGEEGKRERKKEKKKRKRGKKKYRWGTDKARELGSGKTGV